MDRFYYFAYGSNMLTARLQARCKSAKSIGIAVVDDFTVAFSKRSKDESGKATVVRAKGHDAYGVVFTIHNDDLSELENFEGKGYDRHDDFSVRLTVGHEVILATTYEATKIDAVLKPYDWYLALVIAGAREHDIDCAYINKLRYTAHEPDHDVKRKTRIEAIEALEKAGYPDFTILLRL